MSSLPGFGGSHRRGSDSGPTCEEWVSRKFRMLRGDKDKDKGDKGLEVNDNQAKVHESLTELGIAI
jgi:hypothetical protein